MFFPTAIILLSQGLIGSSYVVIEENGYYSSWRSNSIQSQPGFVNPLYFPFNFNPFSWWQSQQAQLQEEMEKELIRDRQTVIFDILKCVVNEDEKKNCKILLKNTLKLFPEIELLQKPEPQIEIKPSETQPEVTREKCSEYKPDIKTEVKPLEIINLGIDSSATQETLSKVPSLEDRTKINNEESSQIKNKSENKSERPAEHIDPKSPTKDKIIDTELPEIIPSKDESVETDKKPSRDNEKLDVIKVVSEKPLENQSIIENQQTATVFPDKPKNSETAISDKNPVKDKSSLKETELANS